MSATQLIMLGEGAGGGPPNYIEDVFSTYLYTGNGSTQTITNGIDLAGKGGMVWSKSRSTADPAGIFDTARGATNSLRPSGTTASLALSGVTSFDATGFTLGSYPYFNGSGQTQVAWTFREQPKFFDVVTYTGNGNNNRLINHNLGSTPGCVIVKCTSDADEWAVWHRSLTSTQYSMALNTTAAQGNAQVNQSFSFDGSVSMSSTQFVVSQESGNANSSDKTYVAYLFAHDAGGFGLTGTDNVISCGSFTSDGSGLATINLGYEAQWVLIKNSGAVGDWEIYDTIRGMSYSSAYWLRANLSSAEANVGSNTVFPTATGFSYNGFAASQTGIYIAIRRGPMKVPTNGTSVFSPVAYTGTNVDNRLVDTGIVTDMTMARIRTSPSTGGFYTADRLRGNSSLGTATTDAENTDADSFMTPTVGYGISFSAMNGFGVGNDVTRQLNQSSTSQLAYAFKRAASFFDAVCYDGKTGTSQIINHNLGVAPELVIIKKRQTSTYFGWPVYLSVVGTNNLYLNDVSSAGTYLSGAVSSPTSTTFTVSNNSDVNGVGSTFVAYLFATCAGVSKVGSYTGTGATQTISCGFTGGARFVLIKRTDATGDWWVWDTARGMVAGTDPRIRVNLTSVETNANWVYTTTGGFQIVTTATDVNASGGTYIFLAIA